MAVIGASPVWCIQLEEFGPVLTLSGEWVEPGRTARISGLALKRAGVTLPLKLDGWRVERLPAEDALLATRL